MAHARSLGASRFIGRGVVKSAPFIFVSFRILEDRVRSGKKTVQGHSEFGSSWVEVSVWILGLLVVCEFSTEIVSSLALFTVWYRTLNRNDDFAPYKSPHVLSQTRQTSHMNA